MTYPQPGEEYKHLKSGGVYEIIGCGVRESDREIQVIYQSRDPKGDGPWWIRPADEFMDGRFELQPK